MEFGVCFKGGPSPKRLRCLAQQLDAGDFDHCWFYDSHILWRDCYVAMATCIEHTGRLRLGACVTNPGGSGVVGRDKFICRVGIAGRGPF